MRVSAGNKKSPAYSLTLRQVKRGCPERVKGSSERDQVQRRHAAKAGFVENKNFWKANDLLV